MLQLTTQEKECILNPQENHPNSSGVFLKLLAGICHFDFLEFTSSDLTDFQGVGIP